MFHFLLFPFSFSPVDLAEAGHILDDDIYAEFVTQMPAGVAVTAIIDCCHSGTAMDLPYTCAAGDEAMKREEGFKLTAPAPKSKAAKKKKKTDKAEKTEKTEKPEKKKKKSSSKKKSEESEEKPEKKKKAKKEKKERRTNPRGLTELQGLLRGCRTDYRQREYGNDSGCCTQSNGI